MSEPTNIIAEPYEFEESSEVERELARVNLLRIRGQYDDARLACLKLLNDHPNSAPAHTLMGDICVDKQDLPQAAEWFEMAIGILPESQVDAEKLESVRRRMKDREAANTAEMLGLPTSRPKVGMFAAVALGLLVLIAAAAYLVGRNLRPTTDRAVIRQPITIPEAAVAPAPVSGEATTPPVESTPHSPTPSRVEADRTLLGELVPGAPESILLLEAMRDPRSRSVHVTVDAGDVAVAREVVARVGAHALERLADCPSVTVRVLRAGQVEAIGDVSRDAVVATSTEEWRGEHENDPGAFATSVVSNLWTRTGTSGAAPPSP
ncbi:MAG: hypothetical protein KIS66_17545 [Fimbriimonadaceae bacterium]|nr:hypothetical protein [Fimbriimonadaceae bacterium]